MKLDDLSALDYISPTWALVRDRLDGFPVVMAVSVHRGWSGRWIKRLLNQNGIKNWGWMVVRDKICFTVTQAHEQWAKYILARHNLIPPPEGSAGIAVGDDAAYLVHSPPGFEVGTLDDYVEAQRQGPPEIPGFIERGRRWKERRRR